MEYFFPLMQAIGNLLAFLLVHKLLWKTMNLGHSSNSDQHGTKQLPEPPGAWPVIGHLHLLGGQIPACRTLGALADRHGPIFAIRLGTRKAIIVSSWEVVKECFTTHDRIFLSRPKSAASTYLGYGTAFFGLGPSGRYWQEIRKIATLKFLSNRRLDLLTHVRESELQSCIKHLYSLCSATADGSAEADMSRWFSCVTMNTMVRMTSGKRYCSVEAGGYDNVESRTFVKAIEEFMYLSGVFVASDFIPCVRWLDFQGYVRSMKSNAKELDEITSKWLEEHVRNRRDRNVLREDHDFMDAILSSFDDNNIDGSIHGYKSENVIKATTLNLIIGGVDTILVALTWVLSLLLNDNQVLRTAQEELDQFVGRERWVEESDINKLVYLQAIIKETLRLYPPGPLSVPREAMEDCCLAGYHVPKGTILLVNLWKLHRDPRIWLEPEKFKPERFLTSHVDVDVRGQQFEYIPFSSGRRACPGISSAMRFMPLTLARVLQGFVIVTPRNEPVDMSEGLGLSMPKTTPLQVILSPRLPHELYN